MLDIIFISSLVIGTMIIGHSISVFCLKLLGNIKGSND